MAENRKSKPKPVKHDLVSTLQAGLARARGRCQVRPTRFALRRYGNVVVAIVAIATLSIGLSSCGTSTNTQFAPAHPGHPMGYRVIVFAVNTVSLDVSAVDAATGKIIRTIPVGRFSYAMATSPNGEWGYVADTDWGGTPGFTMIPVNLVTWKVGKPIRVGMGPFAIAITPNGKWAYVADMGKMTAEFANQPPSANPPVTPTGFKVVDAYTVTPVNLMTGKPGKPIRTGPGPGAIAITPNGKWAYVANSGSNTDYSGTVSGTVTPINLQTNKAGKPIRVGPGPMGIAITPNGKWAYVANAGWWGHMGDTVTPINLKTNKAGKPIPVGKAPIAIAITPNGKWAYVANSGYGFDDTVTPINLATNTPLAPITVGPGPDAIAITPDGKWAYVADPGNTTPSNQLTPINLTTNKASKPITVGLAPGGVAIARVPIFKNK